MMRRFIVGIVSVLAFILYWSLEDQDSSEKDLVQIIQAPSAIGSKEDPLRRYEFEIRQQVDPKTGKVPFGIHQREIEYVKKIPAVNSSQKVANLRKTAETWTLAGPSNVGGRTRALALDVTDESIILAGGVSGGMWRSTNAGLDWQRTSHPATINSATCIAQDIRDGMENIWYHGTGELSGNSPRAPGAPYRGDGIFKSLDGGQSWALLPSTSDGLESEFNSPFNYVWDIVTNHTRTDIDEVFAAVYGGIVRSQDGGASWTTVLGMDLLGLPDNANLNDSGASFYTNVMITTTGTLYATLSIFSLAESMDTNKGVFRSIDGVTWENITPNGFASAHERTVMAFAPSNDNIIYFAVDNGNLEIWKYDDSDKSWEEFSQNTPDFDGNLGPFDAQGGYNMMVAIHPDDEDIVYIGGTNLYRSTDGFRTSANTSWIGGYDPGGSSETYAGHHPDQHALVFYPSDPNRMISANDGGLYLTNNNLVSEPFWNSLNNGYVTSQFFTIAISQESGTDNIIGGMQDNGTYLKTVPGQNQPWNSVFGGDGGFAATTEGNLFWYASFQNSQIFRLTLNETSNVTSFARVDPIGGDGFLFINPYVLDPNNFNRMYLAGGEFLWRNNNLSQIPGSSQEPSGVNWDRIDLGIRNTTISALDVSTVQENFVYLGTSGGFVYKIENADLANGEISQIFNSEGYVVNVSIDPSNADNVFVLFSNYNVPSIFFSDNGGDSFVDVGGNLEEFPDGTGNGPSIRWSEIIPLADGSYKYFVGTSAGLYSTTTLDGTSTVWLKEGNEEIGNSVVRMMDYRYSDGRFVIATHGNGVFETSISNPLQIQKPSTDVPDLTINRVYPTPFSDNVNIEFSIPEQASLNVRIADASGRIIKTLVNFPQFAGNVNVRWDGTNAIGVPVADGMYFYRIFYDGRIFGGKVLYDRQ